MGEVKGDYVPPVGRLVKPWEPRRVGGVIVIVLTRCTHCADPVGVDEDGVWWHHAGDPESDVDYPPWRECEDSGYEHAVFATPPPADGERADA